MDETKAPAEDEQIPPLISFEDDQRIRTNPSSWHPSIDPLYWKKIIEKIDESNERSNEQNIEDIDRVVFNSDDMM